MRGKSFLFFSATTFGVAVFFILNVAIVNAYAVPSPDQPLGGSYVPPSGQSSANNNYNFDGSFQNLISPFQSFFNNLQWNAGGNIQIYPTSTGIVLPPVNITPSLQNIFTQFDNWFYGLTNIRLSGLVVVILTGLSWTLGFAKGIADWLLGLFR